MPTESPDLATITQEGGVIGTPAYMAPEQIRGDKLDARCDQFAWGVMAFEVLSHSLPWRAGLTTLGLLAAVLTEPAPSLVAEGVSKTLARVVDRAMSKAAEDRFPTMEELIHMVRELIHCHFDEGDERRNAKPRLHLHEETALAYA